MLKNFSNTSYFFKNKSKQLSAALFSAFLLTKPAKAALKDHIYTCEDRDTKDIYHAHYMNINLDSYFKSPESQQKKDKFIQDMIERAKDQKDGLIKEIKKDIDKKFFGEENFDDDSLSSKSTGFTDKFFFQLTKDPSAKVLNADNLTKDLTIDFSKVNITTILQELTKNLNIFKIIKEFLFPDHKDFNESKKELREVYKNCDEKFELYKSSFMAQFVIKETNFLQIEKKLKEQEINFNRQIEEKLKEQEINFNSYKKETFSLLDEFSKKRKEFFDIATSIQHILLKKKLDNIIEFIKNKKNQNQVISIKDDKNNLILNLSVDNVKNLENGFENFLKGLKQNTVENKQEDKKEADFDTLIKLFQNYEQSYKSLDSILSNINRIKHQQISDVKQNQEISATKQKAQQEVFKTINFDYFSKQRDSKVWDNYSDFVKNTKEKISKIHILERIISTKEVEKGQERGLKQDIDYFFNNFCKDIHMTISYKEQEFCSDDLLDSFKRFIKEFVNRPTKGDDFCTYSNFNTFLVLKFKTVFLKTLKDEQGNVLHDDQNNPRTEAITFINQKGETKEAVPHISLERCMPVFNSKEDLEKFITEDNDFTNIDLTKYSNDKIFLKLIYNNFKDVLKELELAIKDELLSLHLKTTLLDECKDFVEKLKEPLGVASQRQIVKSSSSKENSENSKENFEKSYYDLETQLNTAINNMEKEVNDNEIEKIKLYDIRYNMDILKEDNENNQQIEEDENIESTNKMKQDIEKIKTKIKSKDEEIKRLEEEKSPILAQISENEKNKDEYKHIIKDQNMPLNERVKELNKEIGALESNKKELELKIKEIEDIEKEIKQKKQEKIEKIKEDNLVILKFFKVIEGIEKNEDETKDGDILKTLKELKDKIKEIKNNFNIFNVNEKFKKEISKIKKEIEEIDNSNEKLKNTNRSIDNNNKKLKNTNTIIKNNRRKTKKLTEVNNKNTELQKMEKSKTYVDYINSIEKMIDEKISLLEAATAQVI